MRAWSLPSWGWGRRVALPDTRMDPTSLRVLELGDRLQRAFGRAGPADPALVLLEPSDRDRHVMLGDAQEPACANDRVGDRSVWRDDQVVDHADLLVLVVVHVLAQDLLLGTPPDRHRLNFLHRDPERGGARHLRPQPPCRAHHDQPCERERDHAANQNWSAVHRHSFLGVGLLVASPPAPGSLLHPRPSSYRLGGRSWIVSLAQSCSPPIHHAMGPWSGIREPQRRALTDLTRPQVHFMRDRSSTSA